MVTSLTLYTLRGTDPYRNLAAEYHFTRTASPSSVTLLLWQNRPSVVIGKHQNYRKECDGAALAEDGVTLVRRLSGGGAVFHDEGNLCFSFCSTEDDHDREKQLSVILRALAALGVSAEASGRNDVTVDGKKISGNAFYTLPSEKDGLRRLCHHGTLLLSTPPDRIARYLTVSPQKLSGKGIDSVRARVTTLSALLPTLTADDLREAIASAFSEVYGLPLGRPSRLPFSEGEIDATANALASADFLYGETAPFSEELSHRFPFGQMTFCFSVEDGRVKEVRIENDLLDESLVRDLVPLLRGEIYDLPALAKRISSALPSPEAAAVAAFLARGGAST